jgi:hypothetical protein
MKYILLASIICIASLSQSQSVGVRAGVNFSKFSGPLEATEKYGFSNGFHFGINYGYKFTKKLMLRAEVVYSQAGSKQTFDGDSYYIIYKNDFSNLFEKGRSTVNLDISNAYINLPLVAAYQLIPKIEIYGGFATNFLINPTANGTLRFESKTRPLDITFRQSLGYNYYTDVSGGTSGLAAGSRPITILVDGERTTIPKYAGAYYQDISKPDSRFKVFDLTAVAGVNYFFNSGFYAGARLNYGLTDVTNQSVDRSLVQFNDNSTAVYRNDRDINFDLEFSLGFRF